MIRIDPPRVVIAPSVDAPLNRRQQELPLVVVHAPEPQVVETTAEDIEVTQLGFNRLEVIIGSNRNIINRQQAFRLLGMLERSVGDL